MKIDFSAEDLRPLVATVVEETLQHLTEANHRLPDDRYGFSEAEAAQRMGIAQHRLRDARLRGEIRARKVGKSYVYSRESLVEFLRSE